MTEAEWVVAGGCVDHLSLALVDGPGTAWRLVS